MYLKADHTVRQYRNVGILFLCILIVNILCTAYARADFNTIAGKSESNKLGQLFIKFTGADGKPEERELSVYYSGSNSNIKDTVSVGRTGHSVSLVAGTYDVKIPVYPILWIRSVVIENGKTTDLDVGGYGRILINGKDSNGNPLKSDFRVYTDDDKKDFVVSGITNELSEYLLTGTYDVKVDSEFRSIKESIRIVAGRDTVLDLPQSGRLEVRGKNALGDPLRTNKVLIYKSGERRLSFAHSLVNISGELQPGIYDVRVDLAPEVWFEGVEIVSGEEKVLDLPELGRLMVRGKDTEGIPVNGYEYTVYEKENREKDVAAGDINVARDMLPGVYDVRADSDPEVWLSGIEIVAGSVKAVDIPPLPAKTEKSDELPGSAEQGRIQIVGKNAMGDPLESYFAFYVYASGEKKKSVAEESVSKPVDIPPGVYDVRVGFMPDVWFKSVEVAAGQSKEIELPLPGRLDVRGKNALGNSVNSDFYSTVYKSGDREKPLAYQYVNWYKDLPAGVYDILVNMNPSAWYDGIVITAGKSIVIELPVPGRLEIRGADVVGASVDAPFSVYTDGDREKVVADGVVNFPLGIQPGMYDIKIVLDKDEKWFNGIEIVSQQSKIIELSTPGRLWIYGKDEGDELLSAMFTVYADGDKETVVGRLNETVDLPAGIYDVRIDLEPKVWYKGVAIVGGQMRKIDLSKPLESEIPPEEKIDAAGVGYAKLTAVPKEGADPYDTGVWWYVYPIGADGKPAEKYIEASSYNPSDVFILPPGRYQATITIGKGSAKTEFEVKVAEMTEKSVVIGVGFAKLTAVPEEGAAPYDTASWYVYPVGTDGIPAEQHIGVSYYNPSDIFTLPPGRYQTVLTIGKGSAKEAFEVRVAETTEKSVVIDVGFAKLTAVPEEGAEPYKKSCSWYIYPVGADGNLAERNIDVSYDNPSGIFILPPGRYQAVLTIGQGSTKTEFDVKVAETTERSVVVDMNSEEKE